MFPCGKCWRKYTSEEGLTVHLEKDHPDAHTETERVEEAQSSGEKQAQRSRREVGVFYLCPVCDQKFWSAGKLLKHSESRHPGIDLLAYANNTAS